MSRARPTGLALDHLVVAAETLAQGAAWCEATLGVAPGPGGVHDMMGTHNRLLKIAGERFPRAYLEIIAVDPAAPPPARSRWFGLDDSALHARLRESPRLIHFVARSAALDAHRRELLAAGFDPGVPVKAARATPHGLLSWRILVRPDGRLLAGGALPTLIEWDGPHPTDAMPESGITLQGLELRGLPEAAAAVVSMPHVPQEAGPGPALRASLSTPRGRVTLEST